MQKNDEFNYKKILSHLIEKSRRTGNYRKSILDNNKLVEWISSFNNKKSIFTIFIIYGFFIIYAVVDY